MNLKRAVIVIAAVLFVGFIGIQFIRPDRSTQTFAATDDLFATGAVPPDVAAIFERSCNDCHTNQTRYPWYSNVAPVSWWLVDHVQHGREHMNFNAWNTYDDRKKIRRLEDICAMVEAYTMPLPSYLLAHRDAVLTANDKTVLCEWTRTEEAKFK